MTADLATIFEGKEIRVIEHDNDVWIPIADIANAWGIDRSTPDNMIKRNARVFEGLTSSVLDVTSTPMECINERGLYLMMGKISAGRLKNKAAEEAIIRFQRWFPELIQRYRKGEIVPVDDILRSHLAIADSMVQYAHVDRGIAVTVAIAKVEHDTGADLKWISNLVKKDRQQPPGFLTPTQVGEELGGLSPRSINRMLQQLGYQYLVANRWTPTKVGECFSENVPFTRILSTGGSHSDYQLKWSPEIVRKLQDHLNGTSQAQAALTSG